MFRLRLFACLGFVAMAIVVAESTLQASEPASTAEYPAALQALAPDQSRILSQVEASRVRGSWFLNLRVGPLLLNVQGFGRLRIHIARPGISAWIDIGG